MENKLLEISLPSHVRASQLKTEDKRSINYNQLIGSGVSDILNFLRPTLPQEFAEFDKKGRGDAINIDLYGWDSEQAVGVVQIRQAFRKYRNGFLNVRKTYVLCGFNENGEMFRHPVSSGIVHGAINKGHSPAGVVMAVQCWMWGITPKKLEESVRQGDVLIVPERDKNPIAKLERKYRVELEKSGEIYLSSHVVKADEILVCYESYSDEPAIIYAKKPVLSHTKGEHADTRAPMADNHGWYSVRLAKTAPAWDFGQRYGD